MQRDHLKQVPFFAGLPKKELDLLAQQTDEIDVAPGKVLAREGDLGHEFFVIESGSADVTRGGEQLGQLGAGDYFGELALLDEDRRTATVTATSPMALIVMTRSNFRSLDRAMPEVHATVCARIEAYR
jgi:CRP/FNR family transcriptional regulator, cyclic AMP receptor protein